MRRYIGGCQAPVMRSCCPPGVPVRNVTPASRLLSTSGATQFFVYGIKAADAAQNAHDIKAVESLLLGSPNFLWIRAACPFGAMMQRSNVSRRYMKERGVSILRLQT
jgi:hypothetical protein